MDKAATSYIKTQERNTKMNQMPEQQKKLRVESVDVCAAALLAEVDVLAAFSGEEVSDLLHKGRRGSVGSGVALHLHLCGQEAADELDLLRDEILRLGVVEERIVDPHDHLLAHVANISRYVNGVGGGAQAKLGAVN